MVSKARELLILWNISFHQLDYLCSLVLLLQLQWDQSSSHILEGGSYYSQPNLQRRVIDIEVFLEEDLTTYQDPDKLN